MQLSETMSHKTIRCLAGQTILCIVCDEFSSFEFQRFLEREGGNGEKRRIGPTFLGQLSRDFFINFSKTLF